MVALQSLVVWGWLIFWIYWIITASKAKKSLRPKNKNSKSMRLLIFIALAYIILFFPVNLYVITNGILLTIGFLLFLAGVGFAVWARINIGTNWGMPMTTKENPELVTSGPYQYVRHPIYTGVLLALLGSSLVDGIFWLFAFGLLAIYFVNSAIKEEEYLSKEFPKEYPKYMKTTKRIVPFIY
jgi:protein-S-isoprenylcysteine O-methyltransferase Ste14